MDAASVKLETPLGELMFYSEIQSEVLASEGVSIDIAPMPAALPDGMAVESIHGVLLRVQHRELISLLRFYCRWSDPSSEGDRSSGEGLDAQSWEDDDHIVMVGTEDSEYLSSRLDRLKVPSNEEMVDYLDDGFVVSVEKIPAHKPISLHFVVASNSLPEAQDCDTWFAVDASHERVLQYVGG